MGKTKRCPFCDVPIDKGEADADDLCSVCSDHDKDFFCKNCLTSCDECGDSRCHGCGTVNSCNDCGVTLCDDCMGKAACDHCRRLWYCTDCLENHEKKCDPKRRKRKKQRKRTSAVVWVCEKIQKKHKVSLGDISDKISL